MPFSSIDDFYEAYKIYPNEDLSHRQYEGAMAIADGLTRQNEELRHSINEMLRVLAYALEKTGPLFVPDIITVSTHDQDFEISVTEAFNRFPGPGRIFSVCKKP